MDSQFLRVVPKCLLKVARKSQAKGNNAGRQGSGGNYQISDRGKQKLNREATRSSDWLKERLALRGLARCHGSERGGFEDRQRRQSLREDTSESGSNTDQQRVKQKFLEGKGEVYRGKTVTLLTADNASGEESEAGAEQGEAQPQAGPANTKR